MTGLVLKRASASRPSGEWNDDDFDVLADGEAVGRIFNANAAPVGSPWMWTLIFPHHEGRTPTHGYFDTTFRMDHKFLYAALWSICTCPLFASAKVYSVSEENLLLREREPW
jgi:hypothetical protein